jgi:hypothetical protein
LKRRYGAFLALNFKQRWKHLVFEGEVVMKHGIGIVTVAALMFAGLMSGSANADITITFTEALDGGFSMIGTGSGSIRLGKTDDDFDQKDFNSNYLDSLGTYGDVDATSVGGTLKNVTSGISVGVEKFEVDADNHTTVGTGADDLAIKTDADITFATDDLFEIDFYGTYLVSNIAFSHLIVGTHIMDGFGESDEIFGVITVNVVPLTTGTPGTLIFGQ